MKVGKDVDMMSFSKENRAVLPQLFKVACRILCVPASSSASERVFSTAGRFLEKQRTNRALTLLTACSFCTVMCRN